MSQSRTEEDRSTSRQPLALAAAVLVTLSLSACRSESRPSVDEGIGAAPSTSPNPLKNAYFGDLHVHTRYSFDGYVFNTRTDASDAYRFAKGEAIRHGAGYDMQLAHGPLDFQAVTDHGIYLGVFSEMEDPESPLYDTPLAAELRDLPIQRGFRRAIRALGSGELAAMDTEAAQRSAWQKIIDAAEEHYEPGTFTTFIGYEYTSSGGGNADNLHRNVIFRGAQAPDLPFAATSSQNPEDLWAWMDEQRAAGFDAIAIPHNSNGSGGRMFELHKYRGEPMDADYAAQRMRNEPVVEITQVKGTSEVHPALNPNDEWADFEIFPYKIATTIPSEPDGSYVRQALIRGLALEEGQGFNPFRFGFVAATDSHNSGGTPEEENFIGKVGFNDGTPERRGSVPREDGTYVDNAFQFWGGSGLAGVWAEENTREAIFEAMRRKESFGTSGPRIRVRFFAGHGLEDDIEEDPEMIARAYEGGVPMGADLLASGEEPTFLAWAMRDAHSAPLQRLQIVKGWLEGGEQREMVYDVACSDGAVPDVETHRCPDNGATVDLGDCSHSEEVGAGELKAHWRDPSFDASQRALYYVRVLENPTCRWSTWDALRAGVAPRESMPATIQERAWSSPIWFLPSD